MSQGKCRPQSMHGGIISDYYKKLERKELLNKVVSALLLKICQEKQEIWRVH